MSGPMPPLAFLCPSLSLPFCLFSSPSAWSSFDGSEPSSAPGFGGLGLFGAGAGLGAGVTVTPVAGGAAGGGGAGAVVVVVVVVVVAGELCASATCAITAVTARTEIASVSRRFTRAPR